MSECLLSKRKEISNADNDAEKIKLSTFLFHILVILDMCVVDKWQLLKASSLLPHYWGKVEKLFLFLLLLGDSPASDSHLIVGVLWFQITDYHIKFLHEIFKRTKLVKPDIYSKLFTYWVISLSLEKNIH